MTLAIHVEQTRSTTTLGASDAPAALGIDRFKSPIDVWRRLRGLPDLQTRSAELEEAAEWGHVNEPVIRGRYAAKTGTWVSVPTASVSHPSIRWLHATPDGVVMPVIERYQTGGCVEAHDVSDIICNLQGLGRGQCGLVQCKNVSAWTAESWATEPPRYVRVQCEVEMCVMDLPWCDAAALIGGNRYVCWRVHRDMDRERRIIEGLSSFWRLVEAGIEPGADSSESYRRHATSGMSKSVVELVADAELESVVANWRQCAKEAAAHEAGVDLAKNTVLARLKAASAGLLVTKGHGTIKCTVDKNLKVSLRTPSGWKE